jgi:hypothetical protein
MTPEPPSAAGEPDQLGDYRTGSDVAGDHADPVAVVIPGPLATDDELNAEPLNVKIGLLGVAHAANDVADTREQYKENYPQPPPDPPLSRAQPAAIQPISPGQRITPPAGKYVVDRSVGERVNRRPG